MNKTVFVANYPNPRPLNMTQSQHFIGVNVVREHKYWLPGMWGACGISVWFAGFLSVTFLSNGKLIIQVSPRITGKCACELESSVADMFGNEIRQIM